MNKLLIGSLLALMTQGCATIHEKCSDPDIASRYRDYDQCYAELSQKREIARQRIHNAFNQPQSTTTNCTRTMMGGYRCESQ